MENSVKHYLNHNGTTTLRNTERSLKLTLCETGCLCALVVNNKD